MTPEYSKGDKVIIVRDNLSGILTGRKGKIVCFVEDIYPGEVILEKIKGGVGIELNEPHKTTFGSDDCRGFAKPGYGIFTNMDCIIHDKLFKVKDWIKYKNWL